MSLQQRILLTGSNGLLGQKIVNLLANRIHTQLLATSRGINRHPLREGYDYESADLTDPVRMEEIFQEFQPTSVIHTAAMTQVDACEDDRSTCDQINIEAVHTLCDLVQRYDSHLVHISTDFVFDGEAGPYREEATPKPVNYYGLSKLKAEQSIQAAAIPHAILRTILLYGITPAMSRSNIVLWVKQSLEAGKPIRVVNDQFRSPTLAEDLADAAVSAAMKRAQGLYHISGPDFMGVNEIAYAVADYFELDKELISEISSTTLKQRAKRPPRTGFIILKAQTELGYAPRTFREGLTLVNRQMKELSKN